MGNIKMDVTPVETCNTDGLIHFILFIYLFVILFYLD